MHRGGELENVQLALETWGKPNEHRDNTVLIFSGLSPSAHAASSPDDPEPGWWEQMLGPGKPIDTNRYHVVCVNSLGSCFGSTGPAATDPQTGKPYRLSFPVLSIEDIARAAHAAIKKLGIDHLAAVIGPSMGGMTALAFCLQFPGMCDAMLNISAAARATPFAIALRSLQREIIRSDPDWHDGNYDITQPPVSGMRLARKLGMITYRSPEEWLTRFGRDEISDDRKSAERFSMRFEIESYLDAAAKRFTGQFDPNCYLYLSCSIDLFDVAAHGGSVAAGFEKIDIKRAMVIGVKTDRLFPLEQQHEIADNLACETEFVVLDSIQGHDSFLVDMDSFKPVIARFFD